MRRRIVAANWKMNLLLEEARGLFVQISEYVSRKPVNLIVCPAFPYLYPLRVIQRETHSCIALGAQNCHEQSLGAYTGEVSAPMLKALGLSYVILGHSERRQYFGETGKIMPAKVDAVLRNALVPIYCCGEPRMVRDLGTHKNFVKKQIEEALFHLDGDSIKKIIIAYEPVWAIGSSNAATLHQIQSMHKEIRDYIASKYDKNVADAISLLYGGSVKADNARAIFDCPDVDGALVGGASLQAKEFCDIIQWI